MNRTEKQQAVEDLGRQFREISNAFLIDYRGLKVVDATELRRKIREIDGSYVVVKNTLAMRAAKDTPYEALNRHFEGPTAVAFHRRDIVGLAKLLTDVTKTNPNVQFKAGLVEGRPVSADDVQTLASMPSREVMIGRLLFLLMSPLQRLASVLKAPARDLSLVLKQIEK